MTRRITRPFSAENFTPTEHSSAADKARFANHFVRFVEGGYRETVFPKWFYNRLSMCFGHIAHYNRSTFHTTWFATTGRKVAFTLHALNHPRYGAPEYTYSDVERALQDWLRARHVVQG